MFRFLRIFYVLSLVIIAAIAAMAGMGMRSAAIEHAVQVMEVGNSAIGQGYINMVWKRYRDVIVPLSVDPQQLKGNATVTEFAQETVRYFQEIPLLRVNVYNSYGVLLLTINLDNGRKIAGAASPNPSFVAVQVKSATTASQFIPRVPLQNGEAAMVQTLVPIRNGTANDGAIEILRNATDLKDEINTFQIYGTGGVIGLFVLLLCFLSLTSKRAEGIIAKQHEANVELAAAAATAQAESRDKSQFLANISHELRTPLNAIIGFSDVIKNEVMPKIEDKKYHDYINDIHASGVHLLSLINDILDYSKAEAGKLELEVSEINVTKTVQNSMRLVGPRAEAGGITLSENLPREQFTMSTDGKKFKQVLLNLLSNAVKFTPTGGKITISAWHNVTEDTFSFEVQDSGIGIAPKDISRAMAPFGQVDNTLKRKYEGTGLGLPLTKKFVELMGGKFNIESELGKGTKITFTLPREMKPREGVVIKQAS